jgi:hypothetical protein
MSGKGKGVLRHAEDTESCQKGGCQRQDTALSGCGSWICQLEGRTKDIESMKMGTQEASRAVRGEGGHTTAYHCHTGDFSNNRWYALVA